MYKIIQTFQMLFNTDIAIIKKSGLFDAKYYLKIYPDVREAGVDPLRHFVRHGWKEGRNPSEEFDTDFYLSAYPDVAQSGMNPLIHYIRFGENEGRRSREYFQILSFQEPSVSPHAKTLKETISSIQKKQDLISNETTSITIITPKHTLFVAHLLYKELTENDFKVQIETTLSEGFGDNLYIIICPQIFDSMPKNYIAFQMEQLASSTWFGEWYFKILKNSLAIFDYSIQNLEYLQNNSFSYKQLFHLPIVSFENYQQFLIEEGYSDGRQGDKCDVLFYGTLNARRQNYIDRLQERFSVKIVNEVFGNDLYNELLSAKVIVNIHFYENALLETTRIHEGLSLGLKVVSEDSSDMDEYLNLLKQIDFVGTGEIDHMIAKISQVLEDEEKGLISSSGMPLRSESTHTRFNHLAHNGSIETQDRFDKLLAPVCVINLEHDHERRKDSIKQLHELGIDPHIITAVNGHQKKLPWYQYNHLSRGEWWQKNVFKPGAFACYLSHVKCWEKIATGNSPYALILEDDIIINKEVFQKFSIDDKVNPFDVIFVNEAISRLFNFTSFKKNRPQEDIIPFDEVLIDLLIHHEFNDHLTPGSYGYLVSKQGATKLLKMTERDKICIDVDYALIFGSLNDDDIEKIKAFENIPYFLQKYINIIGDEAFYLNRNRISLDAYVATFSSLVSHKDDGVSSLNHNIRARFDVFHTESEDPYFTIKDELVSVVIPCYNQAEYVKETVTSVLNQTYTNTEIIIVNDGSTDKSKEIVQEISSNYPDRNIHLINQVNKGLSEARNSGVRAASGDFIFILDADDKLKTTMISKCMHAMMEHDVDIVYADYQRFGEEASVQKTRAYVDLYFIQYANITGPTALFRKDVWEKTGGYKVNMNGGYEDWEFWVNATKNDFKFYHIPEVLFYYRVKKESMYTDALTKHTYLCSKIVMNHSELYTDKQRDDALNSVKLFENLPDLYFYLYKDGFKDEKEVVSFIGNYIHENSLKKIIQSDDTHNVVSTDQFGSIALCSLISIENNDKLVQKASELAVDYVVYYAKLKYDIVGINGFRMSSYAWDYDRGLMKAEGSSFPLILSNNLMLKLAAYKRSEQFIQDKYQGLEAALLQNNDHFENLELKLKDQEEQIKRLGTELTHICTSKSWRYTRIVRQLRKKLLINKKISKTEVE